MISRTLQEKMAVLKKVDIIAEITPDKLEHFMDVAKSLGLDVWQKVSIGPFLFISIRNVPVDIIPKLEMVEGVEILHYDKKVRFFFGLGIMDAIAEGIRPRDFFVAKEFNIVSILKKQITKKNEIGTHKIYELSGLDKIPYDGSKTKVCVIDTGIALAHPAFAGKRIKSLSLSRFGVDRIVDSNGHGTFVSAEIIGRPTTSVKGIKCRGMCNAELVSIKALRTPFGVSRDSDVLKAIEIGDSENSKIFSMSLGSRSSESYLIEPTCKVMTYLTNTKNRIFVVAAGNDGPSPGTINSPGHCKEALTVGSCNMQGQASEFSSRGPTVDNLIKPDVVFYGGESNAKELIHGPTAPRSSLDPTDGFVSLVPKRAYASIVGTSMATPLVAGIVAVWNDYYMDKYGREITRSDIESIIKRGVKDNNVGYGKVDARWIGL